MKKILTTIVFVGLVLATSLFRSGVAHAANNPFACTPDFYQVISGQLKVLNSNDGSYSNIGSLQDSYNAIGYNVLDNYIYGIRTAVTMAPAGTVGDLVKIGSDGTMTNVGPITGGGWVASGYVNGSMDLVGNLYIRIDGTTIKKIDVSTQTATNLTTTGDAMVTGSENVYVSDNKLYMMVGTSPTVATMSVVDLDTNVVTNVAVSGPSGWLISGINFGAGWSTISGDLFFSHNLSGSVYQIVDIDLGAQTAEAVFKLPGSVTSNNDGANCPTATSTPFDPPVAVNDHYTTPYNTVLNEVTTPIIKNDSGNVLTVTSHTNPSHGTLTQNADGTFTYTPDKNFSGTDSYTYTVTDSAGRTASATVTITILPLAPDTGYGAPKDTRPMIFALASLSLVLTTAALNSLRRRNLAANNNRR